MTVEQSVKTKRRLRDLAPARLIVCGASALAVGAYYLLRGREGVMERAYYAFTRPCAAAMSRLCSRLPFSAAEALYVLAIVFVLAYTAVQAAMLFKRPDKAGRCYRTCLTLLMTAGLFWAGFSWCWSTCYYAPTFAESSGLEDGPVSTEALESATVYFAGLANEYAAQVERDGDGVFAGDREDIIGRAARVYRAAAEKWPCLRGEELRPKGMFFSKVMSLLDFTGFYFPLTGEANLNLDSPAVMLPATAEHEISHQRGVAREQECNFIAVAACMESEYADYRYSGALLAYIYLGNALYAADCDAWSQAYSGLSPQVLADLRYNSAYWEKYDTAIQKVSNTAYESFLRDNGQELGLQSYGACVDLLVNYYGKNASDGN